MKESVVERYLVKRVRALGGETRKVVFPGHRGAPDRIVLFPPLRLVSSLREPGSIYWVELKSPKGKLRPSQEREHARLLQYAQTVVVLKSTLDVDVWLSTFEPIERA